MKFARVLHDQSDPELRHYYLAYKELKQAIKVITGATDSIYTIAEVTTNFGDVPALAGSVFRPPQSRFKDLLETEKEKINQYCSVTHIALLSQLKSLVKDLLRTDQNDANYIPVESDVASGVMSPRHVAAVMELEKCSCLIRHLADFVQLNFTGFRKILKKYDKYTASSNSAFFLASLRNEKFLCLDFHTPLRYINICSLILTARRSGVYDPQMGDFGLSQCSIPNVISSKPSLISGACSEGSITSRDIIKEMVEAALPVINSLSRENDGDNNGNGHVDTKPLVSEAQLGSSSDGGVNAANSNTVIEQMPGVAIDANGNQAIHLLIDSPDVMSVHCLLSTYLPLTSNTTRYEVYFDHAAGIPPGTGLSVGLDAAEATQQVAEQSTAQSVVDPVASANSNPIFRLISEGVEEVDDSWIIQRLTEPSSTNSTAPTTVSSTENHISIKHKHVVSMIDQSFDLDDFIQRKRTSAAQAEILREFVAFAAIAKPLIVISKVVSVWSVPATNKCITFSESIKSALAHQRVSFSSKYDWQIVGFAVMETRTDAFVADEPTGGAVTTTKCAPLPYPVLSINSEDLSVQLDQAAANGDDGTLMKNLYVSKDMESLLDDVSQVASNVVPASDFNLLIHSVTQLRDILTELTDAGHREFPSNGLEMAPTLMTLNALSGLLRIPRWYNTTAQFTQARDNINGLSGLTTLPARPTPFEKITKGALSNDHFKKASTNKDLGHLGHSSSQLYTSLRANELINVMQIREQNDYNPNDERMFGGNEEYKLGSSPHLTLPPSDPLAPPIPSLTASLLEKCPKKSSPIGTFGTFNSRFGPRGLALRPQLKDRLYQSVAKNLFNAAASLINPINPDLSTPISSQVKGRLWDLWGDLRGVGSHYRDQRGGLNKNLHSSNPAKMSAAVRVEPKTFFANERTLLQWMNISVLLATVSITLLSLGNKTRFAGLLFAPIAIFLLIHSYRVYTMRNEALVKKSAIDYVDRVGPLALTVSLVVAMTMVLAGHILPSFA